MPAPQPVKSLVPKLVPVGTATPQPAPVLSAGTFQANFDHPGMNLSKFSDSAKRSDSRLANAQQLREERVDSAARNRDRKRSAKIARARQLDAKRSQQQQQEAALNSDHTSFDEKLDGVVNEINQDFETLKAELANNEEEADFGGGFTQMED
eukprot:Sro442_g143820.1 n/a (152) ;mRNA; r:10179-10634